MNEIEAKRKELEEDIDNAIHDGDDYTRGMCYLNGFNLGVEMARKEIIKFLEDNLYYLINKKEGKKWVIANIDRKIKELKQSLDTPSTKPQNTGSEVCLSRKTTDGMDNRYSEDKTRENIPKEKSK